MTDTEAVTLLEELERLLTSLTRTVERLETKLGVEHPSAQRLQPFRLDHAS